MTWKPDEWLHKLDAGGFIDRARRGVVFMEIARALNPRLGTGAFNRSQIIHVPINLTFPLEEQLSQVLPLLREIREYLYRFTRKRPPRSRARTVYRDVYVFLLAAMKDWSVAKIGLEVFPGENKLSREKKVRQIVLKVGRIVREAGIAVPRQNAKTSPPA